MGRSNDAGAGAVPIKHPEASHVLLTGSDLSWICDLAEVICGSEDETTAYIEWLRQRTLVLLETPAVWACVEALASALLEHKTLSAQRARRIFWAAQERLLENQLRAWEKRVARDAVC